MNIKEKELKEINESGESLNFLNSLIGKWAEKRNWYIIINRVPKKGWLVYGLTENGKQLYQWCGVGAIEKYFDSPITSLNEFINVKFN